MFASIGVIGSGPVGQSLARHASAAGFPVLIANTRGPLSLAGLLSNLGPAALADLVILAIPFVRIPELAAEIGDCGGRVVVDATNQFATYQPCCGYVDLGEQTGTEWVAAHLPGATMIKAFNAMFASYLRPDPRHAEGRQVVFSPATRTARARSSPSSSTRWPSPRCMWAAFATAGGCSSSAAR